MTETFWHFIMLLVMLWLYARLFWFPAGRDNIFNRSEEDNE